MANEASIRSSLNIKKGELDYRSNPTAFSADVSVGAGPTPGRVTVPVTGIAINLSLLRQPGLCWMMNLDPTNYVSYGVKDTSTGVFYPSGELLAGEEFTWRLARKIGSEYVGTGTGTAGDSLWFRADTATCEVVVDVFEK